jgi:hypothetical protein
MDQPLNNAGSAKRNRYVQYKGKERVPRNRKPRPIKQRTLFFAATSAKNPAHTATGEEEDEVQRASEAGEQWKAANRKPEAGGWVIESVASADDAQGGVCKETLQLEPRAPVMVATVTGT